MYSTGLLNSFGSGGAPIEGRDSAAPYVPAQKVLLDAQQTQSLEILGTFARRDGTIQMEMSFINKSGGSIGNFAIQFNKNTFGVTPSGSLNAGTVTPMSSVEVSLPLVTSGPVMEMQPLTNIQIAVRCTAGIFYFQTQYSLHVLFEENGQSDQGMFLHVWKNMPDSLQCSHSVQNLRFESMEDMRNKLTMNNVFTVAQRPAGNATHFYTSSKLCDGSVFYSEIKVANNFQAAIISTKSVNLPLVPLYQKAIEDICTAF
ncbi:AP-1 complex subunit beta [Coemansia thaxteri]|uniref:AP-1 complex subunit beta n=1 Tax=Coemansia thaxteri TaxID=2663907 RepID=A0A9W8ECX9_9FUNG|nr:AP-1 complex subunit beta [Coemansia thaxteri]KAJ2486889.1 AP-1 complex subunit beta [Coemansia sp. RSA 2320]